MTEFDLLAPLLESRRVCSASDGTSWLSTAELRSDLARLLVTLDQQVNAAGAEPSLLVVASDRYHMLLACLAAWCRGSSVVLPPNHQAGTLREVSRASTGTLVLSDAAIESSLATTVVGSDSVLPSEARSIDAARAVLTVFTSGTTGEHQACTKTAAQLFGESLTLSAALGFDATRTVAATVPCHHLYGLLFGVLVPFFSGAAFVRDPLFQPTEVARVCERWKVTDLITVPTHLQALIEADLKALRALERAFSSGAVLPVDLALAFAERSRAQVIDVLGSTESGGIAWRVTQPGSVYVPLPGVEVAAAPDGRLLLRSPFLPPESGWLLMNDRVRMVPGGFEHLGRSDGIVKLGGKRIAVQEIEARARQLGGISDAAVLVQPSSKLRKTELWLAVATEDAEWTVQRLRQELSRYFDPVVLPRRYRIVNRLPRDLLGKLQKAELERLFAHKSQEAASPTRLSTDIFVPEDYPFFQGHFPGEPVLPGVAQLSEFVLPAIASAWGELQTLEEVPVLKYKRPIKPGTRLALEVRREPGSTSVNFELYEDGEVATLGQLCFAVPALTTDSPSARERSL